MRSSTFTPLITYVPILLPQQSVDIPFTVTYLVTNAPGRMGGGLGGALLGCLPDPAGLASMIADFINGLNAIANAEGRCIKDNSLLAIAGAVAITMTIYNFVSGGAVGLLTLAPEAIAGYLGCVIGTLFVRTVRRTWRWRQAGRPNSLCKTSRRGGPMCSPRKRESCWRMAGSRPSTRLNQAMWCARDEKPSTWRRWLRFIADKLIRGD